MTRWKTLVFRTFPFSAAEATFPDSWVARALYDGARVSGQVISHTSRQPDLHGARVTPSGFFPSDPKRPLALI